MLKLFLVMAIHGQVVASVEAVQSPTSPSSCWSEAAEKSMELERALLGGWDHDVQRQIIWSGRYRY